MLNRRQMLALGAGAGAHAGPALAQVLPAVAQGRIERLASFPSRHVQPRPVDVWLPEGLASDGPHQVLYMFDGQMLFDPALAWNGKSWRVHQALARLLQARAVPDTMIVAVWNAPPLRHSEYFPGKILELVPEAPRQAFITRYLQGRSRSDAHLRFLVEELKPAIDARYATRPGPEHTFVMGSSMGGLAAAYAMCEHPRVFGGAAALSPHWVGLWEPNTAFPLAAYRYLQGALPDPVGHRLYMDRGSTELDALYVPYQGFVDELVRDRGYTSANSLSRVFEGQGHNETDWGARVELPLRFLLAAG